MFLMSLEAACTVRILREGASANEAVAYRVELHAALRAAKDPPCPRCHVLGDIGVLLTISNTPAVCIARCNHCGSTLQFAADSAGGCETR